MKRALFTLVLLLAVGHASGVEAPTRPAPGSDERHIQIVRAQTPLMTDRLAVGLLLAVLLRHQPAAHGSSHQTEVRR